MKVSTGRNVIKLRRLIINLVKIVIGTVIMAVGIDLFLLPNQLSTGGFSGIGTIVYYMYGVKVGTTVILLNIPLFILAYFKLGKKFFFNSIIGTALLSYFLNYFEKFNPLVSDRFLAFLYGSIIVGIGSAIVLNAHGSTGGTDVIAKIIKKYKPQFKTGTLIVIIDTIIVAENTLFFRNLEIALYSALGIYILGKVLDAFVEGINFSKMLLIISPKWEEISERINKQIRRGTTSLYGEGMYKREERKVLLCVLSRQEIMEARKIVEQIDPSAFMIITNAREVYR